MKKFDFKITSVESKTKARTGVIKTVHGEIQTPAFVPVGTQACVKALGNDDLAQIKTQIYFANTYHLYLRPGTQVIDKFNGLHAFTGWIKPLITDSGGFQVFSLAREKANRHNYSAAGVKINEKGVFFQSHLDGSRHFFDAEKSIEVQTILGADIMIAFDECTFYPASQEYAALAMERTHRWALRSLKQAEKRRDYQALYGVIQGGVYQFLRQTSAQYINSLGFEGIAIGGVSVGESKKEMKNVLDWTIPFLAEEKPRHLLGVGEIDDIFSLVERGVDSFDCVMPTRLARMGFVLISPQRKFLKKKPILDLNKAIFSQDKKPIDSNCSCFVCQNYSRAYLNHLFKTKELLAYRLATYHNLWFVERLMDKIREAIKQNQFLDLKKQWFD